MSAIIHNFNGTYVEHIDTYIQNQYNPSPKQKEGEETAEIVESESLCPNFFCTSEKFSEQNIRARLAADLAQARTKIDYCRALYRLQHMGCIDIEQYASDAQRADIFNSFQSKFKLAPNDFCRARI